MSYPNRCFRCGKPFSSAMLEVRCADCLDGAPDEPASGFETCATEMAWLLVCAAIAACCLAWLARSLAVGWPW